ncbi:TniQ family protein [Streptomyces sp. NPDC090493]|uniref:TniQ family protein n=1 Tax=Streptomyces sp. NPDC090493 TaxID=3365964 RepID=UPI0038134783
MTRAQHRPLARSLQPLPEESLPGYLLRLAFRLGRSPGRIAELCGISSGRQRRLTADHLLELPARSVASFAQASGLSEAEVRGLALNRYASTYPALRVKRGSESSQTSRKGYFGSVSDFYSASWGVNFSSRFCPDCLAGDGSPVQAAYGGAWSLRWHLPVVFACTQHQRLLEFRCPACHDPINQSYEGRATLITQPSNSLRLHPLQCRNVISGGGDRTSRMRICGARLDQPAGHGPATRLPPADHVRLLDLQRRLNSLLFPLPAPADEEQPHGWAVQDLIHIAQLITLSWPAGRDLAPSDGLASLIDHHAAPVHAHLQNLPAQRRAHHRRLWPYPQDSAQCGALLATAQSVLDKSAGDAALRERVRPLAQSAFEKAPPGACRSFFGRPGFSPSLARAMVRRVHGFYAAGPLEYASLRVPSRACLFTVEEVPSHLPVSWYDEYFTDFADHVPLANLYTVRHLRRAASLKLAEMTAGGSWRRCAEVLDIPVGQARSALVKLRGQIGDSGLWARFEDVAEDLANHLDVIPERINYAQRRRALATWQMPAEDWTALCSGLPQANRLTAQYGTAIGTVLAWTEATQADHYLCPLLDSMRTAQNDAARLIGELSAFFTPANHRGGRLELRCRIARYAARLGDEARAG